MAIGYACLTVGVPDIKYRSCRKDNASEERLKELISNNIKILDKMLDYNIKNDIKLLRISSDIIPFGSHPVNKLAWWEIFDKELNLLGEKAKDNNIRLSMHPGQYTVLNSPRVDVVERAVKDLFYHTKFLYSLNLDRTSKIILHIGGAYGDKRQAIERFKENYSKLDQSIKDRLVIENDDKIFTIEEVLSIGKCLGIPVIYDNLHNWVNPSSYNSEKSDKFWVNQVKTTWKKEDGRQKIHYSQQAREKKVGSHSQTIDVEKFTQFYNEVSGADIDIMLEVKDKNLSAVKCKNTVEKSNIKELEKEWARYKYLVLEHSPQIYNEIRSLLKDKNEYPVKEFYQLIDKALAKEVSIKHLVNASDHIWGYFRKKEDEKSREKVDKFYQKIENGGTSKALKRYLWKLAKKYNEEYLLESLYFIDIL